MTTNLLTIVDLGGILIGVIAVAALIFCISICVEEAPDLSGFLRRAQPKKDGARKDK